MRISWWNTKLTLNMQENLNFQEGLWTLVMFLFTFPSQQAKDVYCDDTQGNGSEIKTPDPPEREGLLHQNDHAGGGSN